MPNYETLEISQVYDILRKYKAVKANANISIFAWISFRLDEQGILKFKIKPRPGYEFFVQPYWEDVTLLSIDILVEKRQRKFKK